MQTIKFKCKCMIAENSVEVRDRRLGEDLESWMVAMSMAVSRAHVKFKLVSLCRETTMETVRIEVKPNTPLGAKAVN